MFRAVKMYDPLLGSHTIEKILGIAGLFNFIISAIFFLIVKDHNLAGLFFALCLTAWYPLFILFIFCKWASGYLLEKDRLIYHFLYSKHVLQYKDVKCIIISNTRHYRAGIPLKLPWITMVIEKQDEIIAYCMDGKKKRVLANSDIEDRFSLAYTYDLKTYLSYLSFSKNYNYGFLWNKKNMYKILEGYQGDYYIAASVISKFKDEFSAICKQYNINDERIHIIDDSTDGWFIWD